MKKSLSIETMFDDVPFYDRFARARAAGFRHVELGDWFDLDITRVGERLRAHGLSLTAVSGVRNHTLSDPEQREDFLEFLSQSLAIAKNFGCPNIVVSSGPDSRPDAERKNDFARTAAVTRALMDASPKAARAGLTLLVKPARPAASGGENAFAAAAAGDVVRVVNSPAVRLLYEADADDGAPEGAALETLRKYRDLIGYVRVVDAPGRSGGCCCGENFPRLRRVLENDLAYGGVVGFGLHSTGCEERCLEAVRGF